ncbi:MAG: hypothetical protein M3Y33_19655 [Actinomycetota bacterium]|nr:hypothetical protein [Actinomycetota bacterium]
MSAAGRSAGCFPGQAVDEQVEPEGEAALDVRAGERLGQRRRERELVPGQVAQPVPLPGQRVEFRRARGIESPVSGVCCWSTKPWM